MVIKGLGFFFFEGGIRGFLFRRMNSHSLYHRSSDPRVLCHSLGTYSSWGRIIFYQRGLENSEIKFWKLPVTIMFCLLALKASRTCVCTKYAVFCRGEAGKVFNAVMNYNLNGFEWSHVVEFLPSLVLC